MEMQDQQLRQLMVQKYYQSIQLGNRFWGVISNENQSYDYKY